MRRRDIAARVSILVAFVLAMSGSIGVVASRSSAAPSGRPGARQLISPERVWQAVRLPANPADGVRLDPRVISASSDYLVQVTSKAVPVVREGVRYWLNLDIWQPGEGATPEVDVFLYKPYGKNAYQIAWYMFQTDRPFDFDRSHLAYQHYDGGRQDLGSSRVSETFTATEPRTGHLCRTFDGAHRRYMMRKGTLSFRKFSIDTGTEPFFGTVKERPAVAYLIFDPGCGVPRSEFRPQCPSAVSLGATGYDPNGGPILFADGPGPSQTGTIEGILDGRTIWHGDWPENDLFMAQSPVPCADLPSPTWDQSGATGSLSTDGFEFGSGAGAFTSRTIPDVKRGKYCRVDGVKHVYTSYHYHGVFVADPQFVDHFVVGDHPIPIHSRGDLYLAVYS